MAEGRFPVSDDEKINNLSLVLKKYLMTQDVDFIIDGNELFVDEVVGHFGCLPLILMRAKFLYEKTFNNDYNIEDLVDTFGEEALTLKNGKKIDTNNNIENKSDYKEFPIEFIENESAFFNTIPITAEQDVAIFSILSHFSLYSIEEYIIQYKKNKLLLIDGRIPLDTLYNEWRDTLRNNKIKIKSNNQIKNI